MATVILTHDVKDFASWKPVFDAGEGLRASAGVKVLGVYSDVDDANKVTVLADFPSVEAIQGFLSSPQLKSDMEAAGVTSAPELKILNKVG